MTNFWGRRGLAAALGLLSLVMGPSEAIAQTKPVIAATIASVPQAAVARAAQCARGSWHLP